MGIVQSFKYILMHAAQSESWTASGIDACSTVLNHGQLQYIYIIMYVADLKSAEHHKMFQSWELKS